MRRRSVTAIAMGGILAMGTWMSSDKDAMAQGMMMGQGMMRGPVERAEPGDFEPSTGPGVRGPGHRWGRGWRTSRSTVYDRPLISEILSVRDRLNLTPAQVQRLQALRSGFEKEAIKRSADIQAAEVDLSTLLEASTPDLGKIEDQIKKISALEAELRFARIKALEQGRTVLSQEQWQKFESLAPSLVPTGPYGRHWRQRQPGAEPYGGYGMMGPGMMGGYGGPGGMMGGYGPGRGYGPGTAAPGPVAGKRAFASNGERIYYTGVSAETGPVPRTGGPMWVYHAGVGCVACHGVRGRGGVPVMMGTAVPEDIRYPTLTTAEHREAGEKKEEAEHPPYTDATIKRAVTEGLDPAGKPLDWTMPRWQLTDDDWADLLAYLKTLR